MASRDTLEAEAVTLGLASVSTYKNKKVVESAIERVKNGEVAATVDNELMQEVDATEETQNGADQPLNSGLDAEVIEDDTVVDDDEVTQDDETVEDDEVTEDDPEAPKKARKTVKHRNQGHPTSFDEFGRPQFRI